MVGVGEFEQFDGRAVFDYEGDADTVGWAVGRNQDFASSKLGGEISHFKRDVGNLPDEIRDRRVRFETHPLDAEFAFLVADDKEFQVFQVGLARLRFSSGNSDVVVAAHVFSLSVGIGTNSTPSLLCLKRRPRDRTFEARIQIVLRWFWHKADSECMTANRKLRRMSMVGIAAGVGNLSEFLDTVVSRFSLHSQVGQYLGILFSRGQNLVAC
jgi:hypothetical protein